MLEHRRKGLEWEFFCNMRCFLAAARRRPAWRWTRLRKIRGYWKGNTGFSGRRSYDFCSGEEEDHFSTQPDYFGYIEEEERRYLAGRPEMLRKWFGNQEMDAVLRYLVHWTVLGDSEPV